MNEELKSKIQQDKFVYSVTTTEVRNILRSHGYDEGYIPLYDTQRNAIITFKRAELACRDWARPIIDLEDFPYCYPVQGITQALDRVKHEYDLDTFVGEFPYIREETYTTKSPKVFDPKISDWLDADITHFYMSNPFSATGNFDERWKYIQQRFPTASLFLDSAYLGTTAIKPIYIDQNVQQIYLGLSKGYGLGRYRIGFLFCKERNILSDFLRTGYFNVLHYKIAEEILNTLPIDWLHNKLHEKQLEFCNELNLTPSDSVLLGTANDPTEWNDIFKRADGTYRICLSSLYQKLGLV